METGTQRPPQNGRGEEWIKDRKSQKPETQAVISSPEVLEELLGQGAVLVALDLEEDQMADRITVAPRVQVPDSQGAIPAPATSIPATPPFQSPTPIEHSTTTSSIIRWLQTASADAADEGDTASSQKFIQATLIIQEGLGPTQLTHLTEEARGALKRANLHMKLTDTSEKAEDERLQNIAEGVARLEARQERMEGRDQTAWKTLTSQLEGQAKSMEIQAESTA